MMKLLRCNKCGDVFSLNLTEKKCSCGETSGRYLEDKLNAVYSGDAVPIGFANNSFRGAIILQPESGDGFDFTAFVVPKQCKTFVKQ